MIEICGSPLVMPAEDLPPIILVEVVNVEANYFEQYRVTNLLHDDESDLGRYAQQMVEMLDTNLSSPDPRCGLYMDGKPVASLRMRYDFLLAVIDWFARTYGLQVRNTYDDQTEVQIEDDPMASTARDGE